MKKPTQFFTYGNITFESTDLNEDQFHNLFFLWLQEMGATYDGVTREIEIDPNEKNEES